MTTSHPAVKELEEAIRALSENFTDVRKAEKRLAKAKKARQGLVERVDLARKAVDSLVAKDHVDGPFRELGR